MPARDDMLAAKQQLSARASRWPWLTGFGVGKVDDGIGLIVSVRQGSGEAARQALRRLRLPVPVRVREVGPIRARQPTSPTSAKRLSPLEVGRLRAVADRRRLSK